VNRFKTCVRPCVEECDENDRACKKSCRKEKCPVQDIKAPGVMKCNACTKKCRPEFIACAKENCADECPKLGPGKTKPCRVCLRKNCGQDPDAPEEAPEEAEE
jgi:hypothetical protein